MKMKRKEKIFIGIGCLAGVAGALATIGETWYLGQIVGILGRQSSEIWGCLAAVLVMVTVEYLSNTLGIWVKQMAQRRIVMDVRRQLFHKSVYVDYLHLKARDSGDLNSLYLSDVDAIGQYYKTLMDSFGQITGGMVALLLCIMISWKFVLVSLCVFPVMLALGELANKNLKKYAYDVQQKKGVTAASLLDAIRNRDMARSYAAQEYVIERFKQASGAENRAVMAEARKRGIAGALNRVSGSFPYLAIFVVGGVLVFGGEIGIGDFFAFAYIFSNVQSLQNVLELRMAGKSRAAAQERIAEFLRQPDAEWEEEEKISTSGEAEKKASAMSGNGEGLYLRDVSFAYADGPDVFSRISLYIEKGDTVGIVGESGSGKSTLLGLLTGLYVPKEGAVGYCRRDGCYEGIAYRNKMAVVFQDNYLFPLTIRENLLMGKPDASEEELLHACEAAGIINDIKKMPEGLDTGMSELGHSLSGGQRQRICIARALVRKPEILIMDEPSASLDTVHEIQLMEQLSSVMKDGILIVVSHRQSTIGRLKTVYSLENGVLSRQEA